MMGAGLEFVPYYDEYLVKAIMLTVEDFPDMAKEILSDYTMFTQEEWDKINIIRSRRSDERK